MASSRPALLRMEHVTVSLGGERGAFDVVRDLSLTLERGTTLGLVGESGCGKSMTALAILGLLPDAARLSHGRILFEGDDLVPLDETQLCRIRGRRLGMIFQEPMTSLNPVFRVGEQVAEPLRRHLGLSRREALQRAAELFRLVGIPAPEQRLQDFPHQLSGGMRQRVMIAMALSCEPSLLIADEPTTALDVTIQGQILALLKELAQQRGMGLLLITHDLGVVAETADQVGVMYAGQLVERAPVRALFSRPLHPYTAGLMRSVPTRGARQAGRLPTIPGTVPAPGELRTGCPFRPRCPEATALCAHDPPLVSCTESGEVREVRCHLYAAQTPAGS